MYNTNYDGREFTAEFVAGESFGEPPILLMNLILQQQLQ